MLRCTVAGYENGTVFRTALQLMLQDDAGNQLCQLNSDDTVLDKNPNGFVHIRVPFQNYPSGNQGPEMDCRAAFQTATMVGIKAQWDGVNFCVDKFQTLPSMVVTSGNMVNCLLCIS